MFALKRVCAELQASQSKDSIFKFCYLAFLRVWHSLSGIHIVRSFYHIIAN